MAPSEAAHVGRVAQDAVDRFVDGVDGRSVFVEVLDGRGIVAARNEDVPRPFASVLKLLIAESVHSRWPSMDELVPVSNIVPSVDHLSVLVSFDADRRLTVRELLALALAVSDNGVADYLLKTLGFEAVRSMCDELAMSDTVVVTGLDDVDLELRPRENVSTAADTAKVLRRLYERREDDDDRRRIWTALCNSPFGRRIPSMIPDEYPIAHKTGTLRSVVNDAGVVMTDPPVLVAAYCDGEESTPAAERAIAEMTFTVVCAATGLDLVPKN